MRELPPECDPNGVYSVKRVCAALEICYKTFSKWRKNGVITPLNPQNTRRPLFSGQSVIDCWYSMAKL